MSPDGEHFLSTAKDNSLKLWNIHSGKATIISQSKSPINTIRYSADGKYAVTAGWDIKVWAMPAGKMLYKLSAHSAEINDIAISKNGRQLVSASWDNSIKLWDLDSGQLKEEFFAHRGGVRVVVFSPDEQHLASAGMDGTLKLWDLDQGKEIVRLVGADNGEWISLTADGYYNHSPEGTQLIHWVAKHRTDSYSFEQFEQQFKKPDIIRARLLGQQQRGKPPPDMRLPPKIELAGHLQHIRLKDDKITLKLKVIDTKPIEIIRIFVNGKLLLTKKNKQHKHDFKLSVPLYSGANQVTVMAYSNQGLVSEPRYLSVYSTSMKSQLAALHILSIGISQYSKLDKELQLSYAHSDADNFIKRIKQSSTSIYHNIKYQYLANDKANKNTIIESLAKLNQADKDDLILIYFAGHGLKGPSNKQFYLLAHDSEADNLATSAINWEQLSEHIAKIKSRVIIFLDACHSGSISNKTVVPNNELAEKLFSNERGGVMVFSAAKGRQYAMESRRYGQGEGLFSYAISKALGQEGYQADSNGNGFVEFSEMVKYVQQFVDENSEGQQTPWLSHRELFGDLPIAKVKQKRLTLKANLQ